MQLGRDTGVVLSDVYPEGPASRAGAEVGDIVLRLDGKPMENGRQLQVNLYSRAVGDTVRLDLERRGTGLTLSVPVVEREDDPYRFSALARPEDHLIPRLGVLGLSMTSDLAALLPDLRVASGVVVAGASGEVVPGSDGQLEPGDVIHARQRPRRADAARVAGARGRAEDWRRCRAAGGARRGVALRHAAHREVGGIDALDGDLNG